MKRGGTDLAVPIFVRFSIQRHITSKSSIAPHHNQKVRCLGMLAEMLSAIVFPTEAETYLDRDVQGRLFHRVLELQICSHLYQVLQHVQMPAKNQYNKLLFAYPAHICTHTKSHQESDVCWVYVRTFAGKTRLGHLVHVQNPILTHCDIFFCLLACVQHRNHFKAQMQSCSGALWPVLTLSCWRNALQSCPAYLWSSHPLGSAPPGT